MAYRRTVSFGVLHGAALLVLLTLAGGCQTSSPVSSRKLFNHQAMIDFSGLDHTATLTNVRTNLAPPKKWELLPVKTTALYTHAQWRSPSTHTAVGIAFAHLPLPLSSKVVVWLAKQEYSRQAGDGKVLQEHFDSLGRYWFDAENDRYHIHGYVVTEGFSAWIIYVGYRTKYAPEVGEITLAGRSLETAVPMLDDAAPTTRPVAADAR